MKIKILSKNHSMFFYHKNSVKYWLIINSFRGQNKETGELKPFAFMIMKKENSAGMFK